MAEVMEKEALTAEEMEMMETMTREELMQMAGCEEVKEPETVEEIKATLLSSGRQVVDFIVEKYPRHVQMLRLTGRLKLIAQQRQEEATEMMVKIQKEYMEKHQSEDYLTNLQYQNEARALAQETVNQEILFRDIWK